MTAGLKKGKVACLEAYCNLLTVELGETLLLLQRACVLQRLHLHSWRAGLLTPTRLSIFPIVSTPSAHLIGESLKKGGGGSGRLGGSVG